MFRAQLTLADMFGPGCVYNPTPSFLSPGILGASRPKLDYFTGGHLTMMGAATLICSTCVVSDLGKKLFEHCGFEMPEYLAYDTENSYFEVLRSLRRSGRRQVVQHVHSEEEISRDGYWIDPTLLSWLNNKANLARLVPEDHVPTRRVVDLDEDALPDPNGPVVVKAATDMSTGAGADVRICRSPHEFPAAVDSLSLLARAIVVEELLDLQRNLCVHYLATPDGALHYLGTADQVSDENGTYRGNWIHVEDRVPDEAIQIGEEIMREAMRRGYSGYAGFDMGVTRDGKMFVFDLNFRLNGSTAGLLYRGSVAEGLGARVIRSRGFDSSLPFAGLIREASIAVDAGIFMPLMTFDPDSGPHHGAQATIGGLVVGRDMEEANARERELEIAFGAS